MKSPCAPVYKIGNNVNIRTDFHFRGIYLVLALGGELAICPQEAQMCSMDLLTRSRCLYSNERLKPENLSLNEHVLLNWFPNYGSRRLPKTTAMVPVCPVQLHGRRRENGLQFSAN